MMDDGDKEPLCTLYTSVSGTENASHLRNAFGNYIKVSIEWRKWKKRSRIHMRHEYQARGSALVQDPKRDPIMIASLLAYKAKLDDICKECFLNDDQFLNILKESFEAFINSRPNRPAELLAKYFDSKIRSTAKVCYYLIRYTYSWFNCLIEKQWWRFGGYCRQASTHISLFARLVGVFFFFLSNDTHTL